RESAINVGLTREARELVTTCSTPLGSPASSKNLPISRPESGVSAGGFTIMVQPAASAAPSLRRICSDGKFQGVIATVTPAGCLIAVMRLSGPVEGTVVP